MNKLGKDELFSIAIKLDLPDLLAFCKSDERINQLICKRNDIWRTKLNEFPNWKSFNIDKSLEETYKYLYYLDEIKEKIKLKETLLEIYNLKRLDLYNNQLTQIPGLNLPNLQELYLYNNQLTQIPDLNLPNLQKLFLYNNQLTQIPEKLKNQKGLRISKIDL